MRTLYCCVLSKEVSSTIFLSFWYDSTWDWTHVSRAIGKHSNHHANHLLNLKTFFFYLSSHRNQYLLLHGLLYEGYHKESNALRYLDQWKSFFFSNTAETMKTIEQEAIYFNSLVLQLFQMWMWISIINILRQFLSR